MTTPSTPARSMQSAPAKAKSARGKRLLLALTSIAFSLLALEGAVRFIKRDVPFQPDPDLIRSLRPNVPTVVVNFETEENLQGKRGPVPARPHPDGPNPTNNIGFRMAEDVGPKAPDERRVLLLGDSFTEGDQLAGDKRFSHLVDQRLKRETAAGPEHWRLLNGAIQNGSPVQYILQLRRWLDLVKPDVVIVDLAPNDVNDDALFEQQNGFTFDEGGAPIAPKAQTRLRLLQGSYLLRYFHVALLRSPAAMNFFFPPASPETSVPQTFDILCREDPGTRAAFTQKTGKYLKKIKEMVEAKGARFGVFLIHYMWVFDDEPFYPPMQPGVKEQAEGAGCLRTHGKPYNDFVEGFLQDAGMRFHNPYDALVRAKAADPKRKLWHYADYHFSPVGHRVVADALGAFVDQLRAGPR